MLSDRRGRGGAATLPLIRTTDQERATGYFLLYRSLPALEVTLGTRDYSGSTAQFRLWWSPAVLKLLHKSSAMIDAIRRPIRKQVSRQIVHADIKAENSKNEKLLGQLFNGNVE